MSRLRIWVLVIVSSLVFGAGGSVLIAAFLPDPQPGAGSTPERVSQPNAVVTTSAPSSPAAGVLTAKALVDHLGKLYPMPNARDNTGYARDAGVVEAIATDMVTLLRFATEEQAQKWVDGFYSADCRRAGAFVLSWAKSGPQDWTSQEARLELHKELQRLVGH